MLLSVIYIAIIVIVQVSSLCDPQTCIGGVCVNSQCQCVSNYDGLVHTAYFGDSCDKWKAWWDTLYLRPLKCDNNKCNEHGHIDESGSCICHTEFDGTETTEWYGPCCSQSSTFQNGWQTGIPPFRESGSPPCPPTCSGNGVCRNGACMCSTRHVGNLRVVGYGPACQYWWWYNGHSYGGGGGGIILSNNVLNPYHENSKDANCSLKCKTCDNGRCICPTIEKAGGVKIRYFGPDCTQWITLYGGYLDESTNQHRLGGLSNRGGKGHGANSVALGCSRNVTCNGHGSCLLDGTCSCDAVVSTNLTTEYFGPDCMMVTVSALDATTGAEVYRAWQWPSPMQSDLPQWTGMYPSVRSSWSKAYCYHPDVTQTCVAVCVPEITCNGNGKCLPGGGCLCDSKFTGPYCDVCQVGWRTSNDSSSITKCDTCAPHWYPPGLCNRYCHDDDPKFGCRGRGQCTQNGTCICYPKYTGQYCTRCHDIYAYSPYPDCKSCDCLNGNCDMDGTCLCHDGYSGDKCQIRQSKPAPPPCPKASVVTAVLLSIAITFITVMLCLGCFFLIRHFRIHSQFQGTTHKHRTEWTDFDKDEFTL
eukprot:NODE_1356_length_1997_cov_56.680896_g1148_i0.p1 GENE.NODE_1356_length_1997_cov_56.680896_g1148_i0~~NODE_1356_length_1997_cov_56.680896_g1148_i0.p1  ORF type:complete len:586 (-),score=72.16 NODE_1356_length_1997_cov_56.680896_g1148_i0:143-1900(-)